MVKKRIQKLEINRCTHNVATKYVSSDYINSLFQLNIPISMKLINFRGGEAKAVKCYEKSDIFRNPTTIHLGHPNPTPYPLCLFCYFTS